MIFFELTDEEINRGMAYAYDYYLCQEAALHNDPLVAFSYDQHLIELAELYYSCDRCMVTTILKADERLLA